MNIFMQSSDFEAWLSNLNDLKAKARILARLRSATLGNFGSQIPNFKADWDTFDTFGTTAEIR